MADSEVAKKVEKKVENRRAHMRVPDHLKKAKVPKVYVPTGKPRGRPPGKKAQVYYVPTDKPRGRPLGPILLIFRSIYHTVYWLYIRRSIPALQQEWGQEKEKGGTGNTCLG